MYIIKKLPIYARLVVTGFVAFIGVLTIIACGSKMSWVKPGATPDEFSKDKYACMQEAQQTVSKSFVGIYGASSSNQVVLNQDLYNACMNARGWYLKKQE